MRKFLPVIVTLLALSGCIKVDAKTINDDFEFKHKAYVYGYDFKIIQHKISGECYALARSGMSLVSCEDFGVKSSYEVKREMLKKERKQYEALKKKFEAIDCEPKDEWDACPSVNEFGEPFVM